jgi:aspartate ammonia-lyase
MHLMLSSEVEDETMAILTRACINVMTSSLSTVPYNQEQCESYLRESVSSVYSSTQTEQKATPTASSIVSGPR